MIEEGDLPIGWALSCIGEVATYLQRGKSPVYAEKSDLPVINQKCIRWTHIDAQYIKFIDPSQKLSIGRERYLVDGDILWNSTGTGTLGRAAIFRGIQGYTEAVADSHVTIIRSPYYSANLLHSWIASSFVQKRLNEMFTGSTNQVELPRGEIVATPIPVPPLPEQRRIVAKLDALQSRSSIAREALDAVAPLLKSFRQSVLQAAVTSALTEEWRSKQRKLPEWEEINIGEVVEDIRYGTSAKCHYQPVATPVLRIPNVGEGVIKLGDIKYGTFDAIEVGKLALAVGDILVIRSNGSADLVGKPALISDREAGYLFAGYLIRLRFLKEKIAPEFALLALRSPQTRDLIESETKSSSGVNNISAEKLRNISISLPPLAEQTEIVRRVQNLFAMADAMEAEFAAAQRSVDQLDQSLLATAFRGELVPQDPSDEPASVLLERIRAARAALPETKGKRGRKASSDFDASVLMAAEPAASKKRGRPRKG